MPPSANQAAPAAPIAPAAQAVQPTVDDPRWRDVVARNGDSDGAFFYSVATTGVYCRPSCAARTPKPENVRFHATAQAAERAGFRPCLRCKPDQPSLKQRRAAMAADACRMIEAAETPPSLDDLAGAAGVSPHHFHRLFKQATGVTPKAYAAAVRDRRVQGELAQGAEVTQAIFNAGYNASSRFYETADKVLGMRPTDYRDGGANADIRFAVGHCSLGAVLAAQSERGICAILLGDDPAALADDLKRRFPRARLVPGDGDFEQVVAAVVGFVDAPGVGLDLPLDIRGTAFQRRVWRLLCDIPVGRTVSYAEVAQRLGMPTAARAVAGACAANAIAVAVPCHRVTRGDGGLAGYRWGVARKRALLEKEKATVKE